MIGCGIGDVNATLHGADTWYRNIRMLQKTCFGSKSRLKMFWLHCSSEENHRRDKRRPSSAVMGGRVDELQAELEEMTWSDFLTKIDTTSYSLDQTVTVIEESFQAR
ncbi:MAG: hypothetical protein L3K26_02735 [Candidatus Hydrogenedentes bacterium]|nr:hypothetical protein [Candidatus Hydrogenedentota bacterium]